MVQKSCTWYVYQALGWCRILVHTLDSSLSVQTILNLRNSEPGWVAEYSILFLANWVVWISLQQKGLTSGHCSEIFQDFSIQIFGYLSRFFSFFWPPKHWSNYDTYENVKLTKAVWSNYSILKYQIYKHLIEEDKFKSNETYSKVVLRNGARAPNV